MYIFVFLLLMLFTLIQNEVIINVFRPGTNRTIRLSNGNMTDTKKKETYDTYLIGGIDAKEKQFPYQVSLIQISNEELFCGGSIITTKHVISAAHCFCTGKHYKPAYDISVGAGDLVYNSPKRKRYDVKRTICHPEYNDVALYHDISMLAIKKEFVYTDKIKNIKLLVGDFTEVGEVVADLNVFISGWGSDRFNDAKVTAQLQYINTLTISLDKCRTMLGNANLSKYVKEWNVCTHSEGQRTCVGDSGGPVVYQNQLLGVVSWSKFCDGDKPGIHTSIAHHNKWIQTECAKDRLLLWIGNI